MTKPAVLDDAKAARGFIIAGGLGLAFWAAMGLLWWLLA